jgi:hypothetical protein
MLVEFHLVSCVRSPCVCMLVVLSNMLDVLFASYIHSFFLFAATFIDEIKIYNIRWPIIFEKLDS